MRMTTVNEAALLEAATFLVGVEATTAIMKLYQLLDTAQKGAYDLGRQTAAEETEKALDEAFDEGWSFGYDEAELIAEVETETLVNEAGDEGYIQGVADARARPAVADSNVQDIINLLAQNAINGELDVEEDELVQDEA